MQGPKGGPVAGEAVGAPGHTPGVGQGEGALCPTCPCPCPSTTHPGVRGGGGGIGRSLTCAKVSETEFLPL